ncbi:MAG: hypothetical protein V1755_09245 [Chloroflexota bacterium]
MEPQAKIKLQPTGDHELEISLELFVRQVEDRALPAGQVLTEQRDGLGPDIPNQVFVP